MKRGRKADNSTAHAHQSPVGSFFGHSLHSLCSFRSGTLWLADARHNVVGRRTLGAIFRAASRGNNKMIGIFSWYGIDKPFIERISSIKETGFDATSMWIGEEDSLVKHNKMDDMPYIVRDSGLFLENAHIPFDACNDIWSLDTVKANSIKNEYRTYIEFCSKHAIPILVMHISKGYQIQEINDSGISILKDLVKLAEDKNVKIALENTRVPILLDKIYETIHSEYLGFCYDSSHDKLYARTPYEIVETYKDKLLCVHLSDTDGINDSHWLPDEGIIEWDMMIQKFPKTYTGIYTLEVVTKNGEENKTFLKKAKEKIETIRDRIQVSPKNST